MMRYRRFPLGALWTNGYLFWDDGDKNKEAFFIDPGGDAGDVLTFLKQNGLRLSTVLLTHGHLDHIAGVHDLEPLVGDRIYVGRGDAGLLRHPPETLQRMLRVQCEPVLNFHELAEGDRLEIGPFAVQVMETPGHTEGSVCFLINLKGLKKGPEAPEEAKGQGAVLASGDTLFAQSVGRTDLEGGDPLKLDESLRRLAAFPDSLHVLPGHGPETSIGEERRHNPFWPR